MRSDSEPTVEIQVVEDIEKSRSQSEGPIQKEYGSVSQLNLNINASVASSSLDQPALGLRRSSYEKPTVYEPIMEQTEATNTELDYSET